MVFCCKLSPALWGGQADTARFESIFKSPGQLLNRGVLIEKAAPFCGVRASIDQAVQDVLIATERQNPRPATDGTKGSCASTRRARSAGPPPAFFPESMPMPMPGQEAQSPTKRADSDRWRAPP